MPVDGSDIVAAAASVLTGAVGWVTGRRGREAQTRTVEATADATQAQAWAAILAGQRQLTDDLRTAVAESRRAEAECQARASALADEIERVRRETRDEMHALISRVRTYHPTPRTGTSTLTAAVDPLETPPDGHRLVAPTLPVREDPDPTPDLHDSVTPRTR